MNNLETTVLGWSIECLEHWGQFFSLSIAGLLLIGIEWWSFEIGTFLSGNPLSSHSGMRRLL